jgi:hypothetical protein
MHRAMCPVVIGLATVTIMAASAGGAYAAAAPSTAAACTAIDAPKAMNDLPASADCPTPGARPTHVTKLVTPNAASTPISMTPLSFDRTNGDLLAITKIDGTNDLAFGGNFSQVYTPDGVAHAATNFAVVDEATGTVLYSGSPANGSSADKYVRSIASLNGVIYVGGDFTSWAGVSRSRAVSLAPTGNPAPAEYAVTSWNPAPGGNVRGLAVDSSAVYLGIDPGSVRAVNPTTGATIWSKSVSGGDVHAVFEDQGYVFVGGLFETYDGVTQHGLVKIQPSDGSLVTAFNAHLRADTGAGQYGSDDGEEIIAIADAQSPSQILVGSGGHAPAGLSSNEAILLDITTGARAWRYGTLGDSQAIGAVGDTTVAGYHNNTASAGDPTSANYFGIQLEDSNGAPTTWDPQVNGNQGNADGGNNGIQAIYVDQSSQTIYIGGAFLHWNGTTGLTHQSLIAFSFAPANPTAPAAPTGVSASAGDTTATVSWTAPSSGGSPITGYTVTSDPAGGTATTTGATSVIVPSLTDGTSYTFTVTATNAIGTSGSSAASNPVTPNPPTIPDPPTGVTATAGDAQASVSWTAPFNGGSAITGYTVTSDPAGGTASTLGATSTTVTGLTNGTAYTFTVVATNAVGPSNASAPSNSVTPTAGSGKSNTAEGGTAGASVTTANSGGVSGNAFTVVGMGSGASLVYATAAAAHGALGYSLHGSSGTATLMGWNGFSATSMAIRLYYNPGPTLPSKVMRLADIRNSTATAARVELSASNQLFIQNTAGTTLTTFPHALQANTWYRIELTISISSSAATINAAYYPADSTTPVDPAYSTVTGNTGTANITAVSIGSAASATWTGTSYFDDLAAQSGSTAFIGPS